MSQAGSGDWVSRLSESLKSHESTRRRVREVLPRYEIQGELGRGGMGVVYRAWDPQLSRAVALKVLPEEAGDNAEARERFLREAQLAAQVAHPNIIPIYDAGEYEGRIYLAMQLIEGRTLDRSGLEPRKAVEAVRDAARAVHHAHAHGIVHRDLKPSNLMIDREGRVYVADFGLARRTDAGATLTISGQIVGTPAYMPPEQARGKAADARSDVYSLGATLYEALAGRPPFAGDNAMEVMKSVLLDEPVFPSRHNASVPKDVEAVILKAMSKAPSARYATAEAMAEDLDRCLKGEGVAAPVRGTLYRLRKKIVRHRWRVTAWSALGGVVLAGLVLILILADASKAGHINRLTSEFHNCLNLRDFSEAAGRLDAIRKLDRTRASDLQQQYDLHLRLHRLEQEFRRHLGADNLDAADRTVAEIHSLDPKLAESLAVELHQKRVSSLVEACRSALREARWDDARTAIASLRNLDPARADTEQGELEKARRTDEATRGVRKAINELDWDAGSRWIHGLRPVNPGMADKLEEDLKKARETHAQLSEREKTVQLKELFARYLNSDTEEEISSARKLLDDLDRRDSAGAALRKLDLHKAEFRVWIPSLDRLSGTDLEKRFQLLASPEYRALDQANRLGQAAVRIGLRLAEEKDAKGAVAWLDRAWELGIREAKLVEQRGRFLILLEDWDRAERDYNELLKHLPPSKLPPPEFARLFLHRGRESMRAGAWEDAFQRLVRAVEIDPSSGPAWHDLGLARLKVNGAVEAAIQDLATALGHDPFLKPDDAYVPALVRHVRKVVEDAWRDDDAARRTEAWKAAERLLGLVIDRAKAPPALLAERSRMRRRLRRHADALADVAALPESGEKRRLAGQLEFVQAGNDAERLKRALAEFEEAVRREPGEPLNAYWRGVGRHALGQDAAADLEAALRAGVAVTDVRLLLANILSLQKKHAEAIEHATRALQDPALTEEEFVAAGYEKRGLPAAQARKQVERDLHYVRAAALFRSDRYEACLADCDRALAIDPAFFHIHNYFGYAKHALGRKPEASRHFQKVIEAATDPTERQNAVDWKKRCDLNQ